MNNFGEAGVLSLADSISNIKPLETLNIEFNTENNIGTKGLESLG